MDVDFWTKELTAVEGAPVIFVLALIVIAGVIWRLISWAYSREVTNLKSDITTLERQLEDARTDEKPVRERVAQLEGLVQTLNQRILAGVEVSALAGTSASMVSTVLDLSKANNRLTHTLAPSNLEVYVAARRDLSPGKK